MSSRHRAVFFDKQVNMQVWKDSMSGKNESRCLSLLENLGYVQGRDFVRQYPILEMRVVDFAFVNEMIAIEIDGEEHKKKQQSVRDRKTDEYIRRHGWAVLRIRDVDLFGQKGSFWKNLIREVVTDRREEFNNGMILQMAPTREFKMEDYL